MNFVTKRHIFYIVLTIFALVAPFLRLNDMHLFLLSFDHKELHLLFTRFDMQELYVMPFLLILLFLTIFFATTVGGRIWCGWACPQTIFRAIFRDFIQTKILKMFKNHNRQKCEKSPLKFAFSVVLWIPFAMLASANLLWFFVPPEEFFDYIFNASEHKLTFGVWLGFTLFLVADVAFLAERFCVYVCPYARVQSVMFDNDTVSVIYDEKGGCIDCKACVRVCPTHIDIRNGMQLDCINCLECVDACQSVLAKKGREGIVKWSSPNAVKNGEKVRFLRFRTVAYALVLAVAVVLVFLVGSKKETLLLNINRNTELYKIVKSEGAFSVENSYVFLVQNVDDKEHKFKFSLNDSRLSFVRPSGEVVVKAKQKRKFVVVLKTTEMLANNAEKNVPLRFVVEVSASDDAKVGTKKEIVFVFPKRKELE